MTPLEIKNELENMRKFNYTLAPDEVFDEAIKAVTLVGNIRAIICSDLPIQEDVLKYKMICEVLGENQEK